MQIDFDVQKVIVMKKSILCLAVAGMLALPVTGQAGGIWQDTDELAAVATEGQSADGMYSSRDAMLRAADKQLTAPIPKLTDKQVVPPSGDKRDYTSLAVYFWPNPDTEDGLPYVRRDGHVNPEKWNSDKYDAKRLGQMKNEIRALARGYAMSGDERYAERAMQVAAVWFIDPETRMNPHLIYAQLVPGKSEGRSSGIIDTVQFIDVVDALYLLQGSKAYTSERQAALQQWFSDYTDWLLTSDMGKKEGQAGNNHGIWYDAQVAVFAHFAGRDDVARRIIAAVPEKRMASEIDSDGSIPRELARTRPMNNSLYALRALLTLARVGDDVGTDLYDARSTNGRSLTQAIDYILPYVKGEKTMAKEDVAAYHDKDFRLALHLANQHYHNPAYELPRNEGR